MWPEHGLMHIFVSPMQRTLVAKAGANLLDVLREHQIPLSYSCMAGRCGTCRCTVWDSVEHAHARGPGQDVLACQTFITQSCTVEVPEPDEFVVYPAKAVKATVTAIDDQTYDIKRLRVKASKRMDCSPGQYAQLSFTPNYSRPYSMAGLCTDDEMEFHVRLVPGGQVSGYIAHHLKVGDALKISGPLGSAYLRRKNQDPMLCVAGGTGLAPILSIVRGALHHGMANDIHLYLGVRSERDVYGMEWLSALQQAMPKLHLHTVVASGGGAHHRQGLVTQAIAQDWTSLKDFRAYICGAPPMVEASTRLVQRLGVAPQNIYADAFYASAS